MDEKTAVSETTKMPLARKGAILVGAAVGLFIAGGLALPKIRSLSNENDVKEG